MNRDPKDLQAPEALGLYMTEKLSILGVLLFFKAHFVATIAFVVAWWAITKDGQQAFRLPAGFLSFLTIISIGVPTALNDDFFSLSISYASLVLYEAISSGLATIIGI